MEKSIPTTVETQKVHHVDARGAAQFLIWARSNGFAVTSVQCGDFKADLADFRIAEADAKTPEGKAPLSVHDALADEFGLERPSDAPTDDDDEGDEVSP